MADLTAMFRSLREVPSSPADAARIARDILTDKNTLKPVKAHVLRTSTLEPLADFLVVEAAMQSLRAELSFGGYEPLAMQARNAAGEWAKADVVILAPELSDLDSAAAADPLCDAAWPKRASDALVALAQSVRKAAKGRLIVLLPAMLESARDGYGDLAQDGRTGERFAELRTTAWNQLTENVADCLVFDSEQLVREEGLRALLDHRMWQGFRVPYSTTGMRALGMHLGRLIGVATLPRRKCLVLDCDNTLWGGVIGEVGKEHIELAPEGKGAGYYALQRDALALARRGVLLALLSKNQEAVVLDALAGHPHVLLRPELIAAHSISFDVTKAQGMRAIAKQLNIGLDSLVFVDDSATECELIRQLVPEVCVYQTPAAPHHLPGFLLTLREFDVARTLKEDHARAAEYQRRKERQRAAPVSGENLDDYLRSLEIKVKIVTARDATLERVVQMEGKTNQFNTTTRRLSRADLDRIIQSGGEVFAVNVADRFGDYGVTVACAVEMDKRDRRASVTSFLMSCRIIGLGAELALLSHVGAWAKQRGATTLSGYVKPSDKNQPARDLYQRAGFAESKAQDGSLGSRWDYDLERSVPETPKWIHA
ncbi:MAG: HAD-IIIC family phosphatase [Planctomycetaceae bacterium]|nr:HAD-IIIC family phosphatase [Planctomycetaceae bacterium]